MSLMGQNPFDNLVFSIGSALVGMGIPNLVPGLTPQTSVSLFLTLWVYIVIRGLFYD